MVGGNLSRYGAEAKRNVGLAPHERPRRALLSIIRGRNIDEIKSQKCSKTGDGGQFADLKLIGRRRRDAADAERIILCARAIDSRVKFLCVPK
jgi:hypothetical protein